MIGRSALANPALPYHVARELGIGKGKIAGETNWIALLQSLVAYTELYADRVTPRPLMRIKQWLKIAGTFGDFAHFDR